MKFEFDYNGDYLELYVNVKQKFLSVQADNNENLCDNNDYNGDHSYIEINDVEEFTKFVEFCKEIVKEWELRNEN